MAMFVVKSFVIEINGHVYGNYCVLQAVRGDPPVCPRTSDLMFPARNHRHGARLPQPALGALRQLPLSHQPETTLTQNNQH